MKLNNFDISYRTCISAICGIFSLFSNVRASPRDEAIDSYLRPIIQREMVKSGNSAKWNGSINGGYLVRSLIDVTGDGTKELILISTLSSHSNYGEWAAFDIAPDGKLRQYERSIPLMAGGLYITSSGEGYVMRCEWPPDFDSEEGFKNRLLPEGSVKHNMSSFVFSYPKIEMNIDQVTDTEAETIRSQCINKKLDMEAILLADYLMNPNVNWTALDEWQTDANDYFARPDDNIKVKNYSDFSPEQAFEYLQAAQNDRDKNQLPLTIKTATPATSDGNNSLQSRNSQVAKFRKSWGWIVCGLCLFIVAYVVKKRAIFKK